LIEASRIQEGHCFATWRPEHWVRRKAAEIKPDGFGRYLHPISSAADLAAGARLWTFSTSGSS